MTTLFTEDLLSIRQAASYLHCKPDTLRKWVKSGRVPRQCWRKPGGGYLFVRDELESWVMGMGEEDRNDDE
jgi:excisionase family DNA binding protein